MPLSRDEYLRQRLAIRGEENPQPMRVPLWEELIHSGESAWNAAQRYDSLDAEVPGKWCFDRFGMTRTRLRDGRIVCIGGEHEDYYDLDFFIYNDVVVIQADGRPDIYGYPTNAFPPTDFHTATLIGDAIYVIGGLGYQGQRGKTATPIYRLDIASMRIEQLTAENPGPQWIWNHRAELAPDGISIRIGGGEILEFDPQGKESGRKNATVFIFNTVQKIWSVAEGTVPTPTVPLLEDALHGWTWLDNLTEAQKLRAAIMRAVAPNSPLFCEDFEPIAKKDDCPHHILLKMFDGSDRWAICDEPGYIGRERQPELAVTFFPTIANLAEAVNQRGLPT